MPSLSLAVLVRQLSLAEIEHLLRLKRSSPKLDRLETRRQRLIDQLAELDKQIAGLAGDESSMPKRRGRKPGRKPAPKSAVKRKQGRKPAVKTKQDGQAGKDKEPDDARREAMLERLAKARAALAAKRKAVEG